MLKKRARRQWCSRTVQTNSWTSRPRVPCVLVCMNTLMQQPSCPHLARRSWSHRPARAAAKLSLYPTARIQTSRSSSVIRVADIAFGCIGSAMAVPSKTEVKPMCASGYPLRLDPKTLPFYAPPRDLGRQCWRLSRSSRCRRSRRGRGQVGADRWIWTRRMIDALWSRPGCTGWSLRAETAVVSRLAGPKPRTSSLIKSTPQINKIASWELGGMRWCSKMSKPLTTLKSLKSFDRDFVVFDA